MRYALVRALLWLAYRLGYESDAEYRARLENYLRRRPIAGSRADIEHAILGVTPVHDEVDFEWRGRTLVVTWNRWLTETARSGQTAG